MCNNSSNRSIATSNTSCSNNHHNKLSNKLSNNNHSKPNNSNSNRYTPYPIRWELVGLLLRGHRRIWEELCNTTSKLCNSSSNNNRINWLRNSRNNNNSNKLCNSPKGYHTGEIRGNKSRSRRIRTHLNTNNFKCNSNGSSNSSANIIPHRRRATSNIDPPSRAKFSIVHHHNNSSNKADHSTSNNRAERNTNRNSSSNNSNGGTRSFSANRPNMLWPRPFSPRYALRWGKLHRI